MKKAYAYLRVSTIQQTEKFGLDVQREEIEKYCSENDIEIVKWFSDEGITGKIIERDGLQEMLVELESEKDVKNVVVLNCSRLWRSDIAGGLIRYNLSKINVDIISVQEPTYSLYTNDASEYLINSIMSALASYDRMQINHKLSSARRTKASQGCKPCGNCVLGYKWDDKHVVIDYNNHLIIQDIFALYAKHKSLAQVQRVTIEKGYKTSTGKDFSKQAIKNIIENDFYIGVVRHAGKEYQGEHEPIISKELFEKVNK